MPAAKHSTTTPASKVAQFLVSAVSKPVDARSPKTMRSLVQLLYLLQTLLEK
jgi:hypothetical protein